MLDKLENALLSTQSRCANAKQHHMCMHVSTAVAHLATCCLLLDGRWLIAATAVAAAVGDGTLSCWRESILFQYVI